MDFYQRLYTSSNPTSKDICSLVEPKIMMEFLNTPVIRDESETSGISTWGP